MNCWRLALVISALLANVTPGRADTVARFHTTIGSFDVELFDADKPVTVQNFLAYVNGGLYTNMIMHRVVQDFVIQGGGFYVADLGTTSAQLDYISTFPPITNEFNVGRFFSNVYGTIAMAKTSDPNSATSQFFFNLADNSTSLDDTNNSGGFTVFGQVLSGTNILNLFNVGPTNTVIKEVNLGSPIDELPVLYSADPTNVTFGDLIFVDIGIYGIYPAITAQPQSQTVIAGQNATFSVTAAGTAPLQYQWSFDGNPLPGATSSLYTRIGAQPPQAGNYTVGVTNAIGGVISSNAVLTVLVPPAISLQPKGGTLPLGGILQLSVVATGTAPLNYQWSRNRIALTNDARVSGVSGPTLAIVNVTADDAGSYQVAVSNLASPVTSAPALVNIVPELVRPTVVVSSPTAGQRWSNAVFIASGKARDNVRLAGVWCRLNDGLWSLAWTSNGYTNWTTSLSLMPATNTFAAYAVDASGNRSTTNIVKLYYVSVTA